MSRNLGRTDCRKCMGVVVLEEAPRLLTRDDVGAHIESRGGYSYAGMIGAKAICEDCGAKYIAWCSLDDCEGYGSFYWSRPKEGPFFDLSYRSTFNDEAGPDDLPDEIVTRKMVIVGRKPWPRCACGAKAWNANSEKSQCFDCFVGRTS